MIFSATLIVSLLSLHALAAYHPHQKRRWNAPEARDNTKTYKLVDMYQGQSFLNDWDFFTGDDPTHGNVNYQTKDSATSKGLAFVQGDGTTVLAVDDQNFVPEGGKRDSVRITTKKKYNGGLFIADIFAMPHGCSVWPAYWSVGPDWPNGGEIDVLEGVHDQPTNQYTLHTSQGCNLATDNVQALATVINGKCASSGADNSGCAYIDGDTRTYGNGFNAIGGGVFAHLWDPSGIRVWHFARGEIPQDIQSQNPNPSSWGPPVAFWSASACDVASHFFDHSLVIDTTLCGDFAGATYNKFGCPGTCAQRVSDPKNFLLAKWKLNYIAVYQ